MLSEPESTFLRSGFSGLISNQEPPSTSHPAGGPSAAGLLYCLFHELLTVTAPQRGSGVRTECR